jgi:dienelactone hydrolase
MNMANKEREERDFEEKEVEFKVDSQKLKGTLFVPDGMDPFPGVIFYHGAQSSRKNYLPICQDLASQGLAALAFDFRGCGESSGRVDQLSLVERGIDAQEALNFLRRQPKVNSQKIGICGVSMGAPQAVLMAALKATLKKENIRSLILRAPAVYNNEYEGEKFGRYRQIYKEGEDWQDSMTFTYLSRFKGDLLIVESEHDEVIPHRVVERYLSKAKKARSKELYVIKGAAHYLGEPDSPYRQEFKKVVVDWFARTLK